MKLTKDNSIILVDTDYDIADGKPIGKKVYFYSVDDVCSAVEELKKNIQSKSYYTSGIDKRKVFLKQVFDEIDSVFEVDK